MVSEKQLEANRRNAQLSTGPRTPEGKETVRGNALTHGLRAETFDVLPGEDAALFQERLAAWNLTYEPSTHAEAELVRRAALIAWKMDRADRYENAVLAKRIHDSVKTRNSETNDNEPDPVDPTALGAFDTGTEGERLRRYQFSLQNGLLRVIGAIAKLKRERAKSVGEKRVAIEAISPAPIKPISIITPTAPIKPISIITPTAPIKPISTTMPVLQVPEAREERIESAALPISDAPIKPISSTNSAPIKPISIITPTAPNKAISTTRSAAPNKANLGRGKKRLSRTGAREIARFMAAEGYRKALDSITYDLSIEKR